MTTDLFFATHPYVVDQIRESITRFENLFVIKVPMLGITASLAPPSDAVLWGGGILVAFLLVAACCQPRADRWQSDVAACVRVGSEESVKR